MDLEPMLTRFDGRTVFRYSNYDSPFWARNNREPGRWHRRGDGAFQYLTHHPDGAWAELARNEGLRTEEEFTLVRTSIWAIDLSQQNLVDYSTFEKAEDAGFSAEALIDDDYARCQDESRRLREAGYAGVVAPSAALPGVVNVTLFGRRVLSRWGVPTLLASSVPACVVAVGGPPAWMAATVRHRGDAHKGYEEYVLGKEERERDEAQAEPEAWLESDGDAGGDQSRSGPSSESGGPSGGLAQ